MHASERQATGEALGDLVLHVTDLVRGVHDGIADLAWPAGSRGRRAHDRVATSIFRAVGDGGRLVLRGLGRLSSLLPDGDPVDRSPRGADTRAFLNGAVGDMLVAQSNALALTMTVRSAGADVPLTPRAVAAAFPSATSAIAVHVHGLVQDERSWGWRADRHGGRPRHELLRDELGLTPVFVRYNSGLRISDNGAALDDLLEALVDTWPVMPERVVVVGHSMGALVSESALVRAHDGRSRWAELVTDLVALGAPHHGAALERVVNAAMWAAARGRVTKPVAEFLNKRSVGIKDLRHGTIDESWRGRDPDELLVDHRTATVLPDHVHLHVVGASLSADPADVRTRVLGDLLVTPDSAAGRNPRGWSLEPRTVQVLRGASHFDLVNHADVTTNLLRVLRTTGRPGPSGQHARRHVLPQLGLQGQRVHVDPLVDAVEA